MSQITVQRKQQALMRVAASRVAMIDSAAAVREHASGCVRALPVSPATIMRVGAAAGAAASVAGAMAGLRRRKKQAENKVTGTKGSYGLISTLLQLLLPVLLPHLRRYLQRRTGDGQFMNF
jgi:hypothetical protein